jgi:RHS repeat-associated protein
LICAFKDSGLVVSGRSARSGSWLASARLAVPVKTPGGKGPIAFLYDANGDLTGDGVRTYSYDQEGDGHVLSAAASGLAASYRYDAFGRRYSKTVNGTATVFVHDDRGDVVAEYDGAGHVERDYAYLPHDPAPVVSLEAGGNVDFRQVDRLGSLMALSGGPPGTGTLLANWYAQPDYGVTRFFTAGVAFGYAGYYFDQETGLYHTRTRYYDPRLGRFLTPDPIRQQGGLNLYAYANDDPLNRTDPSGLRAGQVGNVAKWASRRRRPGWAVLLISAVPRATLACKRRSRRRLVPPGSYRRRQALCFEGCAGSLRSAAPGQALRRCIGPLVRRNLRTFKQPARSAALDRPKVSISQPRAKQPPRMQSRLLRNR